MQKNKNLWAYPWGFTESLIIVSAIMFSGFLIDFFSNNKAEISLAYPANLIFLSILFIFLSLVFYFFKKNNFIKYLGSAHLAIITIVWLFVLVLIMGVFMQDDSTEQNIITQLYLNNVLQSSAFLLLQVFLIVNLFFALLKRINVLSYSNAAFVLNHLGILILIVSLSFGSADITKYTVRIFKDKYTWNITREGTEVELPFAFRLVDFQLENFPAKIGIVHNETDEILKGNNLLLQAGHDSTIYFNDYTVRLKKYLKSAILFGERFHLVNQEGAAPAVLLEITDKLGQKKDLWLSCGSYLYASVLAPLDSSYTLAMLEPEAKKYQSIIKVFFKDESSKTVVVEVNKPVNIMGWDIYQTDYNKKMGEWSDYSVIEMVHDPWLNIVYTGVFMMIAGIILWIFTSKPRNNAVE